MGVPVDINGVHFNIGGYVKSTLDDLKDFVAHGWDGVTMICGEEGDGKSNAVKIMSFYVDPSINISRWAYNSQQFEASVDSAPDRSVVVWDESDELSANWNSKIIFTLKRKFKRIRSKGLFIFLVTPTIFDMNKYFIIHRIRGLFHVYAKPSRNENGTFQANRGLIRFFGNEKKRQLYFRGVKTWDIWASVPDFIDSIGKCPDNYPIAETDLQAKKDESMKNIIVDKPIHRIPQYRAECVARAEVWFKTRGVKYVNQDLAFIFGSGDTQIKRDKLINNKNEQLSGVSAVLAAQETRINEIPA